MVGDGEHRSAPGDAALPETIRSRFCPGGTVERIAADASTRAFFRVTTADGSRRVVLADADGGPAAFERLLTAHGVLSSIGVPVPRIRDRDHDLRLVSFDDLGDLLLADALGSMSGGQAARAYAGAAGIAATIAERGTPLVPTGHALADDPLSRGRLRRELDFFATHDVRGRRGVTDEAVLERLHAHLDRVAKEAGRLPLELAHRDFHARNILVAPSGRLGVVDFQDAVLAPRYYDLVSLVFDPYTSPDASLRRHAAEAWAASRGCTSDPLEDPRLGWVALQRLLKALGTYGYQTVVRGNSRFERAIGPAERAALAVASGLAGASRESFAELLYDMGFAG